MTRAVPAPVAVRLRSRLSNLTPFRLVSIVLAAALAIFTLYPTVRLIYEVFVPNGKVSFAAFTEAAALPNVFTKTIPNTLIVVAVSSVLSVALATVFAWLNERTNARMGVLARILPLSPLLVPALASTIGWVFLLAPRSGTLNIILRDGLGWIGIDVTEGPLNIYSVWGMIFLYTLLLTAFAYLPIATALGQMDPSLEEAARVSGAGPFAAFLNVAVRANKHAIASGGLIAVVIGFATFSIPVIVGTSSGIDILSVEIFRLMTREYPARTQPAVALSFVMLLVIGACWILQRRVHRYRRYATIGGKGARASLVDLGRLKWVSRAFMIGFLLLSSVVPFLGLVYISLRGFWSSKLETKLTLRNYDAIFSSAALGTGQALRVSLVLGLVGAVAAFVLAGVLGVFIGSDTGWLGRAVDAVTKLPSAVPQLVLAVAFLTTFSRPPLRLYGTSALLIIAYLVIYLPQTTIMANAAYVSISRELAEASAVSGAGGAATLRRVLFPLMLPGLAGVAAVQFVLIIGEATVSPFLASTRTPVLGSVMVGLWQSSTFPTIAALGVLMTLVSAAVVTGFIVLASRRSGVHYQ